jgi:hypothetical protein
MFWCTKSVKLHFSRKLHAIRFLCGGGSHLRPLIHHTGFSSSSSFFLSLFLRKMKLLTHNMLSCHIKGIRNGFPFIIEVTKTETVDADYNPGAQDNVIFSSLHATAVITQDRQRLSLMHDRVSETYFPSDSLVSLLSGGKTGQSWEISGKCSTLLLQDWLDFHYCMYGS